MKILSIDHIQLAMPDVPAGGEEKARDFFINILGFHEIPKPAELAKRGGAWFESESASFTSALRQISAPRAKLTPPFWWMISMP